MQGENNMDVKMYALCNFVSGSLKNLFTGSSFVCSPGQGPPLRRSTLMVNCKICRIWHFTFFIGILKVLILVSAVDLSWILQSHLRLGAYLQLHFVNIFISIFTYIHDFAINWHWLWYYKGCRTHDWEINTHIPKVLLKMFKSKIRLSSMVGVGVLWAMVKSKWKMTWLASDTFVSLNIVL